MDSGNHGDHQSSAAKLLSPKNLRPQTAKSRHGTPLTVSQDIVTLQKPSISGLHNSSVYDVIPHSPTNANPIKADDSLYFPLEAAIMQKTSKTSVSGIEIQRNRPFINK